MSGRPFDLCGDCRLQNHAAPVDRPLARTPLPSPAPEIERRRPSILDCVFEDLETVDYRHYPAIKAPVAV